MVREARKRGLGLPHTARALVIERLHDLEETEQLTLAEQWQRMQAWASWKAAIDGKNTEVSWDDVDASFERPSAIRSARTGNVANEAASRTTAEAGCEPRRS